ncbi:phosphatase [Synechococcus sp. ATX 2A4]|nr:phosphatase [Synechococcus sp. ATX 2A4]
MEASPPLYLHCWAGQERSSLLAVALVSKRRHLSLLDALLWVRRTHPNAAPLYPHLEALESLLSSEQGIEIN